MAENGSLSITVAASPRPGSVIEWPLTLPAGATVADALSACDIAAAWPDYQAERASTGIWGRKAAQDQALRDGDRVEIYRELRVDPKIARRERFKKQGARAAGLFSKRSEDHSP